MNSWKNEHVHMQSNDRASYVRTVSVCSKALIFNDLMHLVHIFTMNDAHNKTSPRIGVGEQMPVGGNVF